MAWKMEGGRGLEGGRGRYGVVEYAELRGENDCNWLLMITSYISVVSLHAMCNVPLCALLYKVWPLSPPSAWGVRVSE